MAKLTSWTERRRVASRRATPLRTMAAGLLQLARAAFAEPYQLAVEQHAVGLRRLPKELDGFRVVRRLDTEDPNAWVLLLSDRAGKQKLAAWSAAGPLKAQATPEISLDLTPSPQYVALERPIR